MDYLIEVVVFFMFFCVACLVIPWGIIVCMAVVEPVVAGIKSLIRGKGRG